jgi:hypothetical protein
MFAKLSTLFVAGALIMVAGSNAQAQDFFGSNWGARPAYAAAPVRHTGLFGLGILPVGRTVSSSCPNGQCGSCPNGNCSTGSCANGRCPLPNTGYSNCPNGQCGPQYGNMPVYRSTQYQPVYQQPVYQTPNYNGYYQPVIRPTGYNSANSPFYE